MVEPKFTKGPWHTICASFKPQKIGDEARYLLQNYSGHLFGEFSSIYGEDTDANANLIATAPDMYELLQDIATNYQCMPNPAGVERRIEEVLKKARGEK